MLLRDSIKNIFKRAYRENSGKLWREAIDLFTRTQVNYQSDINFIKAAIISVPEFRKEWPSYKKEIISYFKNTVSGDFISDSEVELIAVIMYSNLRKNETLNIIWQQRFNWLLVSSFE